MRRPACLSLTSLAVLAGLALVACGGHPPCPADPTRAEGGATGADADDPAPVLRVVEQWRQGYEVRSVDVLAAVYLDSKNLTVVDQGAATRGWDAVRAGLTERLGRAKQVYLRLTETAVDLRAGTAIVVGKLTREVSDGVTSVSEAGTLTLTLIGQGADWRIVAEHFSYGAR